MSPAALESQGVEYLDACNARSSRSDWCTEDRSHEGPHRDQEHCVEWVAAETPRRIRRTKSMP